jgi:hypothetical protein
LRTKEELLDAVELVPEERTREAILWPSSDPKRGL